MVINFINDPTLDDFRRVVEYVNRNLKVNAFPKIATNELLSMNHAELWSQKYRLNEQLYSIAEIERKIIGVSHIDVFHGRRSHGGKLALTVDVTQRANGIGSKLLENIIHQCELNNIYRLRAEPTEDNVPMIKLLKKYNFIIEGRCNDAFLSDSGEYLDLIEYVKLLGPLYVE